MSLLKKLPKMTTTYELTEEKLINIVAAAIKLVDSWEYLDKSDTAKQLGITTKTLEKYTKEGLLPCSKPFRDKGIFYRKKDIAALIEKGFQPRLQAADIIFLKKTS
jgi:hypothetical protein